MTSKSRNLFEDLGKPTLRGVRKCPKCGIYNGTRGLSCKNKECKLVFKMPKEKKKLVPDVDAVKIISSSPLQIYSVKLQDSDEDRRTFVHLPTIEGIESLQDEEEVTIIKRSAATCYAPGCLKPIDDIGTLQLNFYPCSHTDSVVNCLTDAEPLLVKKVVLKSMVIAEPFKIEIASLLAKPEEQLVQRVTKNTMVVKCVPDDLHPLGYLHFSVYEPSKSAKRFRILCGCQTQLTKPIVPREKQMCLHFYMCICAFASDAKLLEEFKPLIQSVISSKSPGLSTTQISKYPGTFEFKVELAELSSELNELKDFFMEDASPSAKRKKNASLTSNSTFLLQENNTLKTQRKEENSSNKKPALNTLVGTASISFEQWLSSVTERINQTMHFQFSGTPEPLVFQVPQVFFDVLQQRLSVGSKKKRLPNSVVGFNTKNSLPMGVFSKYTWQITNILHVKRIFDTPQVPLELTRSFIENRDGTFVPYKPLKGEDEDLAQNYKKILNRPFVIKPLELKTFLKVGIMGPDQKLPTPFIVEWIPDILPITQVGEMRIKFEYGHQRNGIVEHRFVPPATDVFDNIVIQDTELKGD